MEKRQVTGAANLNFYFQEYITENILGLDSCIMHLESLQNSIEKLNYSIKENFNSLEYSAMIHQFDSAPKYRNLDSSKLNDTKNKLQTLTEVILT